MFSFVKEFDENIYDEIVNEVQQTLFISSGYTALSSVIEKILKPICMKELNLDAKKDAIDISFESLTKDKDVEDFLVGGFGLNADEIGKLKRLNKKAGVHKYEISSISKNKAKENFKVLYDVCVLAYKYKFKKDPDTTWDEDCVNEVINQASQAKKKFEQLEEQIKGLSISLPRVELPKYVAEKRKAYKYLPQQKLIKVGNKKREKKVEVASRKQPQFKKVGNQHQTDLSKNQNLEIIFDHIQRGWFLQALEQLDSFKENGEIYYLKLLCENKSKNVDDLLRKDLRLKLDSCDKLISTAPQKIATEVVDKLTSTYYKAPFPLKQQIFAVLSKYDFDERDLLFENFNKDIIDAINGEDFELDSKIIADYVKSTQNEDSGKLRELIELCIEKEKFSIARDLNQLILEKNSKDVYALSQQLLIECEAKSKDYLQEAFQNLHDLSVVDKLLSELSSSDRKLFLEYVDIISVFIKWHQTPENASIIFNLFMAVYKYDVEGREVLKKIVFQYLLSILNDKNCEEIFKFFEILLSWSANGEEYIDSCEQMAVQSLNRGIKDEKFINRLQDAQGKTCLVLKLKFYLNHGLAFSNARPFRSAQKVNKIAFNTLMKNTKPEDRQEILRDMIVSLAIDLQDSEDIGANYKLFNYFVGYLSSQDVKTQYEAMLWYARALLRAKQYTSANTVLRQILSLEYRQYEVLIYMLVCEFQTDSIESLLNCDKPIIGNNYYDMAVKSAFIKDKEAYNAYLDLYSKQSLSIQARQQKRQQEVLLQNELLQAQIDKRQTRIIHSIFAITPLCIVILCISLAIILHSGVGIGILGIIIAVPALILFFVLIFAKTDHSKIRRFKLTLIAGVVVSILAIASTATVITAVNNMTHRFDVVYNQYHCTADIGRNYNIGEFRVNATNGTYSVLSVSIKCAYNNYIESIVIPEGVKSMTQCNFSECANLRKIVIPASIDNISKNAFDGTKKYTIYFKGTESQFRKVFMYNYIPVIGNRVVFNYSGED